MNLIYPTTILIILSSVFLVHAAKIISYDDSGSEPNRMECRKLHFTQKPGCICLNGLWKLFNKCSIYAMIAGDSYCFEPKSEISHAVEILSSKSDIAVVRSNGDVEKLSKEWSEDEIITELKPKDYVVTGSAYTLVGIYGEACVYPQENLYCFYNPLQLIGNMIRSVRIGCGADVPFHVPVRCVLIKGPNVCLYERNLKSRERRVNEGILIRSKEASTASTVWLNERGRSKRESALGSWGMGRTLMGGPGQELEPVKENSIGSQEGAIDEYDEDFIPMELSGNRTKAVKGEILSEVWNHIDHQCQVVLELKPESELEINYNFPYFKLVHMAKKVMKKICPPYYVDPSFFDLSVKAFIQVLTKRFFYEAPTANYPGYKRILEALQLCLDSISTYPFVTPETAGSEASDGNHRETNGNSSSTCDPETSDAGKFLFMKDKILAMNITEGFVGLDKDPIIETVWKIFWTSVSVCYPYFNSKPSYNDHHRYIVWIFSLFETPIMNVWDQGSVDAFTFGGILGNIPDVMTKVAYCAASSRLPQAVKGTKYPWELGRPIRNGAAGGVFHTEGEPTMPGGTYDTISSNSEDNKPVDERKKRSVTATHVRCAGDDEFAVCSSKAGERRSTEIRKEKANHKSHGFRRELIKVYNSKSWWKTLLSIAWKKMQTTHCSR